MTYVLRKGTKGGKGDLEICRHEHCLNVTPPTRKRYSTIYSVVKTAEGHSQPPRWHCIFRPPHPGTKAHAEYGGQSGKQHRGGRVGPRTLLTRLARPAGPTMFNRMTATLKSRKHLQPRKDGRCGAIKGDALKHETGGTQGHKAEMG